MLVSEKKSADGERLSLWARNVGPVEHIEAFLQTLVARLDAAGFAPSDVYLSRLFVPSMAAFGEINRAYATHFRYRPPTRTCVEAAVAVDGDESAAAGMIVEWHASKRDRASMHVQSISEWAPANIGPYSQASTLDGIIYLSGMIALDPASMTMVCGRERDDCAAVQAERCLASLANVLDANRSSLARAAHVLCFVDGALVRDGDVDAVRAAAKQHGIRLPLAVVAVGTLPRGALVELQVIAAAEPLQSELDKDEEDDADSSDEVERGQPLLKPVSVGDASCTLTLTRTPRGIAAVGHATGDDARDVLTSALARAGLDPDADVLDMVTYAVVASGAASVGVVPAHASTAHSLTVVRAFQPQA